MATNVLKPCDRPAIAALEGESVRLEPIDAEQHADDLERNLCGPANAELWEYIPFGAPQNFEQLAGVLSYSAKELGWISFAIRDLASGHSVGTVSLMRIRPEHASAEVGCVVFGKSLKKTKGATEVIYLLANHLLCDLGYRRFEWKCDNRNAASQNAAARYGFRFEGTFRNDMIVKGRNRDTDWFAMTDADWKSLKPGYERWLAPDNFDGSGNQKTKLSGGVQGG